MDKKSYLISILQKLQPYWPMTEGILALVEETEVSEETLDALLKLLHEGVKSVTSSKEKDKFQKAIELVQKIKHQEDEERIGENKEMDDLLASM